MREIKFRAWYIKSGQMATWEDIEMIDANLLYPFMDMLKGDLYKVMQYTGLQDKDDIEIWEGDIRESILGKMFVVEYDADSAAYIGKYADGGYDWLSDLVESYLRGNIYESPHLLDKAI